jgi:membrane protease subunit HflC
MNDNDNTNSDEIRVNRSGQLIVLTALALACALAGSSCTFVEESEWVIVERLGQVVRLLDQPDDRGLNWKLPWPIETTRSFDARVQIYDPPGGEMVTSDKKNITVDAYLCWRIAAANTDTAADTQPLYRFFTTLGNTQTAQIRLAEHVLPALRTRLGETEFGQLVNVDDAESGPDNDAPGRLVSIPAEVRAELAELVKLRYGIELIDVRIKRLNFPRQNQLAVYERMKTERKKIAERYRSEGLAENTRIKSQADLQYSQILANARRDADLIRGRADADSLRILNQAHRRDVEFYRFTRTLATYKAMLNDRTTLVLSGSSPLLKLLTQGVPAPTTDNSNTTPAPTTPTPSTSNKENDK